MGKRELLIALAFVIAGAFAYELVSPPTQPGEGFSWSRLWETVRRGRAPSERVEVPSTQTIPVSAALKEIRLRGFTMGATIVGEDRADISAKLVVSATAPDAQEASRVARAAHLEVDMLGDAVLMSVPIVRLTPPSRGAANAHLELHVPARLALSAENTSGLMVTNLAGVDMHGVSGTTRITDVRGEVAGDFRSSSLTLERIGALQITVTGGQTTIHDVAGNARIDTRSGSCTVTGTGAWDIDARQSGLTILANSGAVRLTGQGGRLLLDRPAAEVHADVRRMPIVVRLATGVPLTLSTNEADIEIALPAASPGAHGRGVTIDAAATNGDVIASDVGATSEAHGADHALERAFGDGPRVTARTSDGNIILKKFSPVEIDRRE